MIKVLCIDSQSFKHILNISHSKCFKFPNLILFKYSGNKQFPRAEQLIEVTMRHSLESREPFREDPLFHSAKSGIYTDRVQ